MSYIIGFILAIGILGISIFQTGDNRGIYWSAISLMIVLGGTFSSAIISFSYSEVVKIMRIIKVSFRKVSVINSIYVIEEIIDISKGGTSPHTLKRKINNVRNFFLKDAIQMIIDGLPREKIIEILETRIMEKIENERSQANIIRTLSKYPAAFGMMGTVIGLVALLQGIGGDASASKIGFNMAVALITTLYGIIIAYFFLVPIADNLDHKTYHNVQIQKMVLTGINLILEDENPVIVKETLLSYLNPGSRGLVKG